MTNQRKFLTENLVHVNRTSKRWSSVYQYYSSNQPEDYTETIKEKGTSPACFKCQYYIKLSGDLGLDWGVCSNEKSPLDGKLGFEHDSCEEFTFAADEEEFK